MVNDIEYLDIPEIKNATVYSEQLHNTLNFNIDVENISESMKEYNSFFEDYLKNRNSFSIEDESAMNELDKHLLLAYESNHEALKQVLEQNVEKYNDVEQLINDIKNGEKNNSVVYQLLANEDFGEIKLVEDEIKKQEQELQNNKRLLEINKYYEKKYEKQNDIVKNLVFLLCSIVVVGVFFKNYLINETTFIILVGLLIGFTVIYFGYEVVDIMLRDPINFDEYNYGHPSKSNDMSKLKKDEIPDELQEKELPEYCYTKK